MERAGLWVVTAALTVYLFVFVPSTSPEQAIYLPRVLFLGGAALLALLLYAERLRGTFGSWLPTLLLVHLALVTASDVLLRDPGGWTYPFFGAAGRSDGFLFTLVVVALALVVITMLHAHGGRTVVRHLAGATLAAGVGQSVVMFLQALGIDATRLMFLQHKYLNPDGTTANSGFVAAVLLTSLLTGMVLLSTRARGDRRWLVPAALVVVAVALGLTGNRTSLLALVVALVPAMTVRGIHVRRWFVTVLLVAVVTAGATQLVIPKSMAGTSQALAGRIQIWRYAVDVITASPHQPWLGMGPAALRLAVLRKVVPATRLAPLHERDPGWPKDATLLSVERIRAPGTPLRSTLFQFRFKQASGSPFFYQIPSQYDKAHDLWLDETASNGLLDGIVWVVIFLGAMVLAWRRRDATSRLLAVAALALAVFYVAWFPAVFFWPYDVVLLVLAWSYRPAEAANSAGEVAPDAA
jgi:O-antigen ligase